MAANPGHAIFDLAVRRNGERATITLTGELDLSGVDALRSCTDLVLEHPVDLVLDLRHLSFCDVAGLEALLAVRHAAQASGHTVQLLSPPRCLQRVLHILDLDDTF